MTPTKIYPYSTPDGIRELMPLEDYEALKKAYDNQVKVKAALTQRPDLGDRAPRVQKLIEENTALREELEDWRDAAKGAESNHADEVHCSCVPLLHKLLKDERANNAAMREAIREAREVIGYILDDSVTFLRNTNIERAQSTLTKLQPYTTP